MPDSHLSQSEASSEHARMTDAEWDALLSKSQARLRELDPALADAVDAEERGERQLTEEERARMDAFLTGMGYLVSGRRVDPALVQVVRYDQGQAAFEAFVGGYEAVHDGEVNPAAVRQSYEEWRRR